MFDFFKDFGNITDEEVQVQDIFQRMVENAFDFLQHAIEEIEEHPKYSIINFFCGIELFFKAALLKEKWEYTVVNGQRDKATLHDYIRGKYKTVGFVQANKSLEEYDKELPESDPAFNCFDGIRKIRNMMVHFVPHNELPDPQKTGEEIATEEIKGLYYLHQLLTEKWTDDFFNFHQEIDDLSEKIHNLGEFLKEKYKNLSDEIAECKDLGCLVSKCNLCNFDSFISQPEKEGLIERYCLVCKYSNNLFGYSCAECGHLNILEEGDGSSCEKCNAPIGLERLIEEFGDDTTSKDYITEPTHAHCGMCESSDLTVVPYGEGYLCLYCFDYTDAMSLHRCEWCGDLNSSPLENSYLTGCVACDGKFGSPEFEKE